MCFLLLHFKTKRAALETFRLLYDFYTKRLPDVPISSVPATQINTYLGPDNSISVSQKFV